MRTVLTGVLSVLFSCSAVFGQAGPPAQPATADSRTLQAILDEVRRLRQDLQTASATVQRMQILLYRTRNQMDVVARATQRLDEAHRRTTQLKTQRIQMANQVKQQQEVLDRTQDPASHKEIEDELARAKDWMEKTADQEPEAETKEAECANELRLEQARLNELQDQLDRLDKKLETAFSQLGQPR